MKFEFASDVKPLAAGETLYRVPHGQDGLRLFLRHLPATRPAGRRRAVLYLNGARLPSAVTVALRLDGRSWRDELADQGWDVWATDYLGYGHSDRFPEMAQPKDSSPPLGRARPASEQVEMAIRFILDRSGLRSLSLIAHSWGASVGALAAARNPEVIDHLVMFGPVTHRPATAGGAQPPAVPAWNIMTAEEWVRVLKADVPPEEPPAMLPHHLDHWVGEFLKCDPGAMSRTPPGVQMPWGAMSDVIELWGGGMIFDPADLRVPTLIVRGEWDSYCTDQDALWLMQGLRNAPRKRDVKIGRGTHFMFYERSRFDLYQEAAAFLAMERCLA